MADPRDLTTVAAVRAFLQKGDGDVSQDPTIQSLVTAASVAIMEATAREFAPATSSAARDFDWDGGCRVELGSYDLRSVTSVVVDPTETSPVTLASTDYRLAPVPAVFGTYSRVEISETLALSWPTHAWRTRRVRVTGAWGFATVPVDVAQACMVTVATWLRRDVQAFSATFNIDENRVERPEALPAQAVRMLEPYRKMVYV